ncbi:zinc finger and SCAN domain-containing protein 12-like [Anopheles stephensi]|uniref:zinc finger and SCAN domain-containing protein 12-like n=1 Tax=Anopheles stephensi TaxID=30069 RepID=UPI00165881B9|nr:zinc finger and SCAN domain-containing protein 12-like [Anopheles stephensi]
MDESTEELNLVEFNIIDNFIGSAVDDLMLKDNGAQYDYNTLASLLQPLCRFCARENAQMVHISDVHLQIINDLRIPENHGSNVCTNICVSCNSFLEEFCKFRSVCEEGQKRIARLLAERHAMPNFMGLKMDFTVSKKDLLPVVMMEEQRTVPKILSAIQSLQPNTVEAGFLQLVEDTNTDLEHADSCESSDYTDSILVLTPMAPSIQTDRQIQGGNDMEQGITFDSTPEADACDDVTYPFQECNFLHQCEQQNFTMSTENTDQQACVNVDSHSENGAVFPTNESVMKDSKKSESRRRVVDGRLQWVCLDCEQVFASCFQLKKHRKNCELVGSKTSKRIAALVCDVCGETMSTESALTMHRRKHEAKANGPTVKAVTVAKSEPTICHVCGHTSKSRRALRLHLITHSSDKNVVCPICAKRFKRRRDLRIHLDVHSGRKYECGTCGKKFLTKVTLRNHSKTHRDSNLKHECTVCARQFVHPHQLQKHMVMHTDEYPYVCDICKTVFRTLGRYKRHIQKGHVLPTSAKLVDQVELNSMDDLIEYQPEVVPCETLDDTVSGDALVMANPVCYTLPEIFGGFASDSMLNQDSTEFGVQYFSGATSSDDRIYYYGPTIFDTSVAVTIG